MISCWTSHYNYKCSSRSVNVTSHFGININGNPVQQIDIPPVGTGTYDLFAHNVQKSDNFIANTGSLVSLNYSQGSFGSQGWLNWFELFCRRAINIERSADFFQGLVKCGLRVVTFAISNADAKTQVWDITSPLHPVKMNTILNGNQLSFSNDAQILHEYVCFSNVFQTPQAIGKIANQNLHSTSAADLIIVANPQFIPQAQALAQFHQQKNNLKTIVVTTDSDIQ